MSDLDTAVLAEIRELLRTKMETYRIGHFEQATDDVVFEDGWDVGFARCRRAVLETLDSLR